MARKRAQFPEPKRKENGKWKFWYRRDVMLADGRTVRKQNSKELPAHLTAREAKKEAYRFVQDINDCLPHTLCTGRTMNELTNQWRALVAPNLKHSTRQGYRWAFTRILPRWGSTAVADIEKADVQQFLTQAGQSGLAPESVFDLRLRLRALLSYAVEWEWLRRNPAAGKLQMPSRKRPTDDQRILLPTELPLICEALRQGCHDKQIHLSRKRRITAVTVDVHSGLRRGELEALQWRHIGHGTIQVRQAVYQGVLGLPKHDKIRDVRIGQQATMSLQEWRQCSPYTDPDDFVFSLRRGRYADLDRASQRHLKPAFERAGMVSFSWHDLRHTYATWCTAAGVKDDIIRQQMGHESLDVTKRIYSHLPAFVERLRGAGIELPGCQVAAQVDDFVTQVALGNKTMEAA